MHVAVRVHAVDGSTRMAHTFNWEDLEPHASAHLKELPSFPVQSAHTGLSSHVCAQSLQNWQPAHPEGGLRLIVTVQHCEKSALLQTIGLRQPEDGF